MRIPRRPAVLTALAVAGLLVLLLPALMARVVAGRIRGAAEARGMRVSWSRLQTRLPARFSFRDLTAIQIASGDTVVRAESLGVAFDPWSLLTLRPRVASAGLSHAAVRLPARGAAHADSLQPETPRRESENPARADRVRRSAESLVRLLAAPARRLPRFSLRDVAISAPRGGEALWSGARLAWLVVEPTSRGVRLAASGSLQGERDLPFEAAVSYAKNDRLTGGGRVWIPEDDGGRASPLTVSVDGAVVQDRRAGVVTVHDTTRVRIGELPLTLGARLERRGPRVQVAVRGDGFSEGMVKRSLPAAVLGPLLDVGVRGRWDYRLGFDLDMGRPDSVTFTADVIPHGLALDPARTRLRLLGLSEPFTASIRLPRDRVVLRDLSPANPNFRPLPAIAPALVHAVVTNEDGGFFRHRGFNTEAVKDAIAENLKAGGFRRGAGTITMQLARNLYLGHERTLSRKAREVVLAWILEHLTGTPKERLLEIYLNIIEWGPGIHGAGEAARYYFDRDPGALSVDEALFLVTVVPAPIKWRYRFDADATLRPFVRAQMHFIGRAMIAKGWLAPEQLPHADSLRVELRGAARAVFFPDSLGAHGAPS